MKNIIHMFKIVNKTKVLQPNFNIIKNK